MTRNHALALTAMLAGASLTSAPFLLTLLPVLVLLAPSVAIALIASRMSKSTHVKSGQPGPY